MTSLLRKIIGRKGVPLPYRWYPDPVEQMMLMGLPGFDPVDGLVHQWAPSVRLVDIDAGMPARCGWSGRTLPVPEPSATACRACWMPGELVTHNRMFIEQLT